MSDARDPEEPRAIDPPIDSLSALIRASTIALQADQLDAAAAQLQRVLELDPHHNQGRNLLGLLRYRAGEVVEAEKIFVALLKENPGELALSLNLAMVYLKAERYRDAQELLRHVLSLHPGQARATELLARAETALRPAKGELDVMTGAPTAHSTLPRAEGTSTQVGSSEPVPDENQVKAAALTALRTRALRSETQGPNEQQSEAARRASREFAFDDAESPDAHGVAPSPEDVAPPPPGASDSIVDDEGYIDPFADEDMSVEEMLDDSIAAAPAVNAAPLAAVNATGHPNIEAAPGPAFPAARAAGLDEAAREIDLDLELAEHEALVEGIDDAASRVNTHDPAEPSTESPAKEIVLDGQLDEVLVAVMAAVRSQGLSSSTQARPHAQGPRWGQGQSTVDVIRLAELRSAEPEPSLPTLRDDGLLLWPLREVGYLRGDLLLGLRGIFELEPVSRRYRGKRTESPFGGEARALVAVVGDGVAWLDPGPEGARVLTLDAEELYLVEGKVLAFSGGLVWDNGRLPEDGKEDLDIVHFSGTGSIALCEARRLRAIEVRGAPFV
ncbi:MAG: tetratricopeptide repeat protein, partial [Myxococcota bacterium]